MESVLIFSSQQREQIRGQLVSAAKTDSRIVGAAHLGSAALGLQDRWSDIDLALCLAPEADFNQVLIDWTTRLYHDHAWLRAMTSGGGIFCIVYSCSTIPSKLICHSGPLPNCARLVQ